MADALSFLLGNVSQLLKYSANLITGAEDELEQLKKELEFFKAGLRVAAIKPHMEEPFREMERQIRKVVYEAEDTIDSCLTQAAAAKSKNFSRQHLNTKPVSLAQEVRSLRKDKVKPMFEKAKMYFADMQIAHGSGISPEVPLRKPKKDRSTWQHVGFEDEEEVLINYLMKPTKELDVISIIGMPGLGKTTLASKIYENPKIQYEFPTRIWICVSQKFNKKDVFLNILKQFTSQDMSDRSDDELVEIVRQFVEKEKFLLVLDDVWSVEAWNEIRVVLPESNWMGKVLITSRYTSVGRHVNFSRGAHQLRFLSSEESWELLQLVVFGKLDACPDPELKRIGQSIAKECHGLPLAIVVIGGILLEQISRSVTMNVIINEWIEVNENLNTYLLRAENMQGISDIIALSYGILPDDLRDCFLYLGAFPEDYEIPTWILTRLWIAEGFIQHKEEQSLEETAEEYLMDLIDRNLVMVEKTNLNGQVKTCRVHDVIHAFCGSKAAEHNLFHEIKMSNQGVFDPQVSEIRKYRRVCIHSHLSEFLSENLNCQGVRSFLCLYKEFYVLHPEYISAIPKAFSLLRVLESKSIKFTRFPMKFTKNLIHLRYISLSIDDLNVLPETISELWNLQTLVVDTEWPSLEVRANIWRMIQLRHLKTKAAIILAIQGEGNAGENLQTLSRLSPEYCTEEVFNRASNLKRLGIRGQLATLVNAKCLEKLDRLEKLKLVNDLFYEPASKDGLHGLPPPNCFPPYLKSLTLSATLLDWKHMSILGKIDTLEVLKLKNNAFTGKFWNAVGDGFHSLQFLLIASIDLVIWEASTDSLRSLRCLVLKNCENLKEIPLVLAKSLEKLDIDGVSKSAADSARKIKEEKYLMQRETKSRWDGLFKLSIGPGCE